jgi:glutathione S-transferase
MIELIQFPWSPFCIVQRRSQDRSRVWKLTKQRYYGVPIIKDGRNVLFEVSDDSQVIAKYLDEELELGLFPSQWRGVQSVLWRFIENEIEGATFRLNDIYWKENVPVPEQLDFLRFKERKFGRGCIDQWRKEQKFWLKQLEERLIPFEIILTHQPHLLDDRPRFVDFDLFGMLENFLYSGHYQLPERHKQIQEWHRRMKTVKHTDFSA